MAKRKRARAKTPWKAWGHAVVRLPQLFITAARRGALPMGVSAVRTATSEGLTELHWKVTGDALVRFFQHSGPVLTKLGQVLATRGDLLPEALCARLEALYDKQPPMAPRQLQKILRKAYPKGLPFETFDEKPIAVGSVGQVHRARLKDGRGAIVKLIRPGSEEAIRRDILTAFAVTDMVFKAAGKNKAGTFLMIRRVLDDLETAFVSELDLHAEARALQDFAKRFRNNPRVCVPELHPELSSRWVLVLEELKGEPLSALRERAKTDPAAAKRAADLALKEILRQVFDEGRFHADPHAGNLLILEDGRLGLIDFGLTGEFNRQDRGKIARAVKALLARDADGVIQALLSFGDVPGDFELPAFKQDVSAVIEKRKAEGKALTDNLEDLVNQLFRVAYQHQIYVPQSTTLLIKTLVTIEGVARALDPDISLMATAIPVVLKSLTPRWLRLGEWFSRRP